MTMLRLIPMTRSRASTNKRGTGKRLPMKFTGWKTWDQVAGVEKALEIQRVRNAFHAALCMTKNRKFSLIDNHV